jgi:DNA-binding response OmpR family regulator
MRVLLAEDHERLAKAVAAGLRRHGMTVDVALDGDTALDRLAVSRYDVVVLDGTCPACPEMTSAAPWPPSGRRAGS